MHLIQESMVFGCDPSIIAINVCGIMYGNFAQISMSTVLEPGH